MIRLYTFFVLFFLLLAPVCVVAKPALRTLMSVKQSDGSALMVYQTGDERFHYYCTADGMPLVREANGDFSYAVVSGDELVSSRLRAHDKGMRTTEELRLLAANTYAGIDGALRRISLQRRAKSTKSAPGMIDGNISQSIKPVGDINVPVLLVQYKDVKFTYTKDDINNLHTCMELEKEGFIYTLPAKGCYVAPKNVELLREENLKKIEEHIEQIAKLAASCNLSRDDIIEMITFGMEEQE